MPGLAAKMKVYGSVVGRPEYSVRVVSGGPLDTITGTESLCQPPARRNTTHGPSGTDVGSCSMSTQCGRQRSGVIATERATFSNTTSAFGGMFDPVTL